MSAIKNAANKIKGLVTRARYFALQAPTNFKFWLFGRDWDFPLGPIDGKAGETHTIVITPQESFLGQKIMRTLHVHGGRQFMSIKPDLAWVLLSDGFEVLHLHDQIRLIGSISDMSVRAAMWVLLPQIPPGYVVCDYCQQPVPNAPLWGKVYGDAKYMHNVGPCRAQVLPGGFNFAKYGDPTQWEELKGAAASVMKMGGVNALIDFAESIEQDLAAKKVVP